VTDPWSLM